jgi:hypothetical protein
MRTYRRKQKHDKESVITDADAVVDPRAMVVEACHALVAKSAVLAAIRSPMLRKHICQCYRDAYVCG